jgi:hypothetical protein
MTNTIRFYFFVFFLLNVLTFSYGQERCQTFVGTGYPKDYAGIYLFSGDVLQNQPYAVIPPHCVIIVSNQSPQQIGESFYRWVTVPAILNDSANPLIGFMKEADLKAMQLKVQTDFEAGKPVSNKPELEKIIVENQKLSENSQRPEPYFARAEVYLKQGDYGRAMTDYFDGLKRVQTKTPEGYQYIPYEKYFDKIKESIAKTLYQPVAVAQLSRNELDTAGNHFSKGYTAYWKGDYDKALRYFGNAIDIVWHCPIYWYYRGLTYWKLSNKEKAAFNLMMGSVMEKSSLEDQKAKAEKNTTERKGTGKVFWDDKYLLQNEVSQYLTRFQGNDRVFLEQIRWGDPSNLIMKEFIVPPKKKPVPSAAVIIEPPHPVLMPVIPVVEPVL